MVKDLLKLGMSLVLGVALALPITASIAHAQEEEEEEEEVTDEELDNNINDVSDLLPTDFTDETGLGDKDLEKGLGELINVALGFLGIVAVIIILFGGFKWMTAGGNDEKVAEAKRLIIAGIIGLAIILSAYAITKFVLESLIEATTD